MHHQDQALFAQISTSRLVDILNHPSYDDSGFCANPQRHSLIVLLEALEAEAAVAEEAVVVAAQLDGQREDVGGVQELALLGQLVALHGVLLGLQTERGRRLHRGGDRLQRPPGHGSEHGTAPNRTGERQNGGIPGHDTRQDTRLRH